MAYKPPKKIAPKGISRVQKIGVGLVAASALVALPVLRSNNVIDWAMHDLAGEYGKFRSSQALPTLSGFAASNVILNTRSGNVKIGEVRVETGTPWMLASSYTLGLYEPPLDSLSVTFSDIEDADGNPLSPLNLMPVGALTGALFDAQGCGDKVQFSETDLTAMGLKPQKPTLVHLYSSNFNEVRQTRTLESPGIGRAVTMYVHKGVRPGSSWLENRNWNQAQATFEQGWSFQDLGFNKARNKFCAAKLGVSEAQFLAAHAASIERLLRSEGLSLSTDAWKTYITYATEGGTLTGSAIFNEESIARAAQGTELGKWVGAIVGQIGHGNQRADLRFELQAPVPFAEADQDKTSYDVMMKEGGLGNSLIANSALFVTDGSAGETLVIKGDGTPDLTSEIKMYYENDRVPEVVKNFASLSTYIGHLVKIERRSGPAIIGEVIGSSKDGLRMRVNRSGGYAEISVLGSGFTQAIILK
jgi:hypothetical protein